VHEVLNNYSLYSPRPKPTNNDDSPSKMLYATSATREFSPSHINEEKRGDRASRKYIGPKVITMNLASNNDKNGDK